MKSRKLHDDDHDDDNNDDDNGSDDKTTLHEKIYEVSGSRLSPRLHFNFHVPKFRIGCAMLTSLGRAHGCFGLSLEGECFQIEDGHTFV